MEVFFFFSISLSNFASKCTDYGKEGLEGTKLEILVLGGAIMHYCLAFSVVIAYLSSPLVFKLCEGRDQLYITNHFIPCV